jgi:hypothetical protein
MAFSLLKSLLPNRPVPARILRGPFRGARIVMNPRESMRKIFGLYEHELNGWLENALKRVTRVLDVGANDGYFCFGCAAAFRRLGINGTITAFEPQVKHAHTLRESLAAQGRQDIPIEIVQALVGQEERDGMTALDALAVTPPERRQTLIKIDVEGAEVDVVMGAQTWMDPSNLFVIEVHQEAYLAQLKELFSAHDHKLRQVEQRALPLLGLEVRDTANWWLVSASVPMT